MWNRNNPYEYSDPTGFAPFDTGELIGAAKGKPHQEHAKPPRRKHFDPPRPDEGGNKKWLPTGGDYPYVPPRSKSGTIPTDRDGGHPDISGQSWQWDPIKEEWDVQDRKGGHTNINPGGQVTHGDERLRQRPKGPKK
jgi:hypothetical protein